MNQVSCDVLVVGGGVAGTTAAVAAARDGARTLLAEKETYLGGTGYAGRFQYICGLYLNGEAFPTETINGGITREIVRLLMRAAPGRSVKKIGQVYVLPYACDDLQTALLFLCEAEKNLTVLRGNIAAAIEGGDGKIKTVTVHGPRGKQEIATTVVIDCSGTGAVAAMAGAEFEFSSSGERQLAGYTVHVKGLKNPDETLSIKVPYCCARAAEQGILPPLLRFTTFNLGEGPDEGCFKMNREGEDGPDRDEKARTDAASMLAYLARVLPAFKDARIATTSLKVLDREGRRVRGDYRLTEEDVLSARKFPDGVVRNAWPIELWDKEKGTIYRYVPRGDYYDIPFRCLMVKGIGNLLCAGRCISVTHEALGSTRVMGACMSLGEQAGRAAAYRVKNGTYPEYGKKQ